ncbi:MAG: endonuclease domain-containing protein [Chryseobacterium sp.]|nr:endonuclease domain-containing protein [Chryseobacterium sp.]
MWKGATESSFSEAQFLRKNETETEKILWENLRDNQLQGFKFRRQHPISLYIADFYCHKLKLIIEIDGGYHDSSEQVQKDQERTEILNSNGLEVIRFTDQEIAENIEKVIEQITLKINKILII